MQTAYGPQSTSDSYVPVHYHRGTIIVTDRPEIVLDAEEDRIKSAYAKRCPTSNHFGSASGSSSRAILLAYVLRP